MKMMNDWLEAAITEVQYGKNKMALWLMMLVVLIIGAASLYVLLNSPA